MFLGKTHGIIMVGGRIALHSCNFAAGSYYGYDIYQITGTNFVHLEDNHSESKAIWKYRTPIVPSSPHWTFENSDEVKMKLMSGGGNIMITNSRGVKIHRVDNRSYLSLGVLNSQVKDIQIDSIADKECDTSIMINNCRVISPKLFTGHIGQCLDITNITPSSVL
jgi:hypothetical protein